MSSLVFGWTPWSPWGACTHTCSGTQTRTRICQSAPADCPGPDVETQNCAPCVSPPSATPAPPGITYHFWLLLV